MEYLNPNPAPCLPQTMWLVYRTIMSRPGIAPDALFDLVVPTDLRARTPSEGAHFRRSLSALEKLRLVHTDGNTLRVEKVSEPDAFTRLLRHRIVHPPHAFEEGFEGAEDIRNGLIWLMRESPTKALDYDSDVATRTTVFTNGTRWNTFRTWCDVLGFGQAALEVMATRSVQGQIVPNPTRAIVDAIKKPFGEPLPRGQQIPIGRLMDFLRTELPVLPGHPSATFDGLEGEDKNALRVVGLALTAAEETDVLKMSYQSDPSGVMALPDAQQGQSRYVSAVTIAK